MIKYEDGEFLDLMPSYFSSKDDVAAISYAVKMAMKAVLEGTRKTRLYSDIDAQDEDVLDLMAIEIKAPYYSDDLDIETKRSLIRKALIWRFKAGTKQAVTELAQLVFGENTEVIEWFDFAEGEKIPGQFDIITDAQFTPELFEKFTKTIEQVKTESAHLRRIGVSRQVNGTTYIALGMESHSRTVIGQILTARTTIRKSAKAVSGSSQRNRTVIVTTT